MVVKRVTDVQMQFALLYDRPEQKWVVEFRMMTDTHRVVCQLSLLDLLHHKARVEKAIETVAFVEYATQHLEASPEEAGARLKQFLETREHLGIPS